MPRLGDPERARRTPPMSLPDEDKSHWPLAPTTSTFTGVGAAARPRPESPVHEADLTTDLAPLIAPRGEECGVGNVALRTDAPSSATPRSTRAAWCHSESCPSSEAPERGASVRSSSWGQELMAPTHSSKALRRALTFSRCSSSMLASRSSSASNLAPRTTAFGSGADGGAAIQPLHPEAPAPIPGRDG